MSNAQLDQFRESLDRAGYSYNTQKSYVFDAEKFLNFFSELPEETRPTLDRIGKEDISKYFKRRNFRPSTARRNLIALSTFFQVSGIEPGFLTDKTFGLEWKDSLIRYKPFGDEEYIKVQESLLSIPDSYILSRNATIAHLLYLGGLRTEEISHLDIGDVVYRGSQMHVSIRQKAPRGREVAMTSEDPIIDLTQYPVRRAEFLENKSRRSDAFLLNVGNNRSRRVEKLSARGIRRDVIGKFLAHAGLSDYSVLDVVHGCRKRFAQQGASYDQIRKRMGIKLPDAQLKL